MAAHDDWGFETRQIHAGQEPDPTTGARAMPIYQTTAYQFRDTDHAAALFGLSEVGNIYTRIMNPTQAAFEARVASLEGATETAIGIPGALAVSSGQSAATMAILNLAAAGDHVVTSASLYGGTYNLFHHTLPRMGIEVSFVEDPDDLDAWRAQVTPRTMAFYGESIGNPRNDVLDIRGVSDLAHEVGVPPHRGTTPWPRPTSSDPSSGGADIVRALGPPSFIGGHGNSIGGGDRRRRQLRLRRRRPVPGHDRARPELPRPPVLVGRSVPAPTSSRPGVQLLRDLGRPPPLRSTPSCSSRDWRR